ncbi:farnesyl diphosphate synthase [Geobacillus stearothermophilus]|uniref:polyprenyl synthetase family protein n=1 Tax=Geobacillus stearothermophilus TaxID=1422 RepID=UPI002E24533E|nr:farnesyl diphosphate synthase [Geobacillus stearothermophilus]MED3719491.1 polyprenyl synthetase family protein [Geobacillus stearothermophilus]MED3722567.1 polyprenyl synthetase family protein [Geobacillus stearothermophilus]MED3746927.1 polyprenyl synthetase family protein [Geobacillus stearothermophilus]MED3753974.1 polyprenyl synthetase family protein [Geobacillus stearothermophilus]MED3769089.1 polyprenyl synthetase family protein [Geobacillus stearothermophilus]
MAQLSVEQFLNEQKQAVETALSRYIERLEGPAKLKKAMAYSLEAGGKRIRALLLLSTVRALGKDPAVGLPVACAIEMIHTYSLIHDDLPSMDNDDLRRGKPTNHKVFGEAMAILAGDGLLTYAFQLITEIDDERIPPSVRLRLIERLAKAAGPEGMVAGQAADMEGEGKTLTLSELEYIHRHKTGKMLQYSVHAGALIGGADARQTRELDEFAAHLGLAFQIRDDILDIEGAEEKIGKPVGSDQSNNKATYPALLSLAGAKEKLAFHIEAAQRHLRNADVDGAALAYICELVAARDH